MSLIKILPESISNKIAAGEVVDRPASVVKELIENSIDASAKNIYVNIENSGKKLISVIDDGVGMDPDDALLCLEAHATSKISKETDINNIQTMGFRGEALPSIASISNFRLRTRKQGMLEGREVVVNGGRFISENPVGCARGTEIRISNLFYNTPARKKFLKSSSTEEKHIYEAFCLLALANHQITFELKMDGKSVVSTPSDRNILSRLGVFFGTHAVSSFLPVDYNDSNIHVTGYVSNPSFVKNNRREQRVFINGRPIKTNIAYSAIREAYDSMIMKGSYPVVTLFIQLNPQDVDINVHPSKHEARFHNERLISSVVRQGIINSLRKDIKPVSSVSTQKLSLNSILTSSEILYTNREVISASRVDNLPLNDFSAASKQKGNTRSISDENNTSDNMAADLVNKPCEVLLNDFSIVPDQVGNVRSKPDENTTSGVHSDLLNNSCEIAVEVNRHECDSVIPLSLPGSGIINVMGFLDKTYILGSSDIGLLLIDQHAAHERILFEKILNETENENHSQKLLIPITVNLSRIESNLIRKQGKAFYRLGFEIEPFGDNTVLVTAIPPGFSMDNISGLISDLLDDILNSSDSSSKIDDSSIAKAACSLAVKAHDALSFPEAEELIKRLAKCKLPFSCPHGRPTVINISFKELEKRFGRKL